jgi:hypothetical protein
MVPLYNDPLNKQGEDEFDQDCGWRDASLADTNEPRSFYTKILLCPPVTDRGRTTYRHIGSAIDVTHLRLHRESDKPLCLSAKVQSPACTKPIGRRS